ncbi:MAG: hypothetical protein ABW360_16280 [Phenylobacterium sp.]
MSSSPPLSSGHLVGRITFAFLLDSIEIARGGAPAGGAYLVGDLLDNLIVIAVVQANTRALMRDPELQRTYAAYDAPPPDELRATRAVSVNALAVSLRLPVSTVRRRMAVLAKAGRVVVTPDGVYVPQATVNTPAHMAATAANYDLLRRLYGRLRDLGILAAPTGAAPAPDGPPPFRAALRLSTEYFLRAFESVMEEVGGPMAVLILLGILRANTEHLPDLPRRGGGQPDDFIPDADRRPISAQALAQRLRLPRETVRRNVARLVDAGECVRKAGGLIIPAESQERPLSPLFAPANLASLNRMFAGLDELGVLAAWERERA